MAENPSAPASSDAPLTDADWLANVYRGDRVPQLTVRAVITGMVIGGVLSLTNLYVSLRTGWSFGVTITAALLAYTVFGAMRATGLTKTNLGILENNAMQSVASAAGYMTGGGTVAVIPGLMLLTGQTLATWQVFLWITALACLGVCVAVPMKRQLIHREQLRFPSGVAAAELLQSLYGEAKARPEDGALSAEELARASQQRARSQSSALLFSALLTGAYTWFRNTQSRVLYAFTIPENVPIPGMMRGVPLSQWTLSLDTSLVLVAGGALMGWRAAWSLLLGALINYGFLAPHGYDIGLIPNDAVTYRNIVNYTLWYGSSLLLTAGLLSLFTDPGVIRRSLAVLRGTKKAAPKLEENSDRQGPEPIDPDADPIAHLEVPMRWAMIGVLIFGPMIVILAALFFHMSWWVSAICIVLSFFLAIVAARATGETDTTPSGSLAKVAQLVSGGLAPGSATTNLISANIAAGVALHASDLLTDLKAGYLLGANARQQFLGQFFGVVAGAAFVVPAMAVLVPNRSVIGTTAVPAPAAVTWTAVARVMSGGLDHVSDGVKLLIAVGALSGIVLVVLERMLPKYKRYIPSAIGFGLAFTLPASNCISMFIGALIVLVLETSKPRVAESYVVPVASGVLAGESLIGVIIALLTTFGFIAAH